MNIVMANIAKHQKVVSDVRATCSVIYEMMQFQKTWIFTLPHFTLPSANPASVIIALKCCFVIIFLDMPVMWLRDTVYTFKNIFAAS